MDTPAWIEESKKRVELVYYLNTTFPTSLRLKERNDCRGKLTSERSMTSRLIISVQRAGVGGIHSVLPPHIPSSIAYTGSNVSNVFLLIKHRT